MAGLIKRGKTYYITFNQGGRQVRQSLRTDSVQIAKERKRQIEGRIAQGVDCPLPTRTPIGEVVAAYIEHMRVHRPERSWRRDLSYLREAFGACCPELELTTARARKCKQRRCPEDRRRRLRTLEAECLEAITSTMVADFLGEQVRVKGLAPKTANRYREVVGKVFSWAIKTERVRMPLDRNPVARVPRFREPAPQIRFLTLEQIDAQLEALAGRPHLQRMVATLIYAGLRREELLWLRVEDVQRLEQGGLLLAVRAKQFEGEDWQPKTRRNRAVPVSRMLTTYIEESIEVAGEGWLYPSPEGARWDPDNFSYALREANLAAGLEWSCLDFRHTFGSQLAQKGVSLFKIATLMGNSPEICRRHYASLVPEMMTGEVEFGRAAVIESPRVAG